MATEIKMPQLSDTMSSGKILVWKKKEGDAVNRGDILAEVETDKANLEIEAFHQGTLLKICAPAGEAAKVGDIIAIIGQHGEATAVTSVGGTATQAATTNAPQTISPPPIALATAVSPTPIRSSSTIISNTASGAQTLVAQPTHASENASLSSHEGRLKISPLAKKIAEERNIDLSIIRGSGPSGRIVKRDLETVPTSSAVVESSAPAVQQTLHNNYRAQSNIAAHAVNQDAVHAAATSLPAASSSGAATSPSYTPLSKMRETIAKRMVEAVTTAPHFYTTTSINMGEALKLRERLKSEPKFQGISVNHLVIKAAAYALSKEPRVNCALKDGQLYNPGQINVGIITAIPDGLLIPVVKDADALSLRDLVFEARAAVERARAGRPSATDLVGGTFSISNMGMFDVENFTAIINPGQGAILAVSSIRQEPVVSQGQVVIGSMMKVTLSVDHRIIDGLMSGTFLKFFKEALENPALMFV